MARIGYFPDEFDAGRPNLVDEDKRIGRRGFYDGNPCDVVNRQRHHDESGAHRRIHRPHL